jgi:hypothetical protein
MRGHEGMVQVRGGRLIGEIELAARLQDSWTQQHLYERNLMDEALLPNSR